ncbi:Proteasome subunit beta type-5-A [Toxocara canis]|uniref:proteasome endopeptidase complex n=1 Tax=Toxocara canis TaxID=6265 RepID=A0A0B2V7H9_TOXCA|nr:Proteasome subunit beta type-5-A [Toxocara canis]
MGIISTREVRSIGMLVGSALDDGKLMAECRDLVEPAASTYSFIEPPFGISAKEFVETHFGKHSAAKNLQFRKGTTTLAFIYEPKTEHDKGGIIVAVDSRASAGEYISSKSVMKILDIGDRMVATMAGGAADCQFWTRVVAKYCTLYELREKSEITVAAASKYFSNVLYGYRNYGLSVGSLIAGYDKRGPAIFKVDSEGQRVQLRLCSVGSGSLSAYGILDSFYQPKMTDEEARILGRRAIMHATFRDSGSGGVCNMVHITPKEKIHLPKLDVSQLFYEFADEIGRDFVCEPNDDN